MSSSADDRSPNDVGELVGRLTDDESMGSEKRTRLLGQLAAALATRARAAGVRSVGGGRWLADVFSTEVVPRIPVRDVETLSRHHHDLRGEALADSLVTSAANLTTAVGVAGGVLAAAEFTAPPLLLSVPAQVTAETLVVAAIEVKLIAELHTVYGVRPAGGAFDRAGAYLMSWVNRRGIDPLKPGSFTLALGAAAKRGLRQRLMRVLGRHLTTVGPFLTGAVAGGTLNRHATKKLAGIIRAELRGKAAPRHAVPAQGERPLVELDEGPRSERATGGPPAGPHD